jgi:hypothetical protein
VKEMQRRAENQVHLNWCVERALAIFDPKDKVKVGAAIQSFLHDTGEHPGTKHIQDNARLTTTFLWDARASIGRFKRALKGFNVLDYDETRVLSSLEPYEEPLLII